MKGDDYFLNVLSLLCAKTSTRRHQKLGDRSYRFQTSKRHKVHLCIFLLFVYNHYKHKKP